MTPDSGGKSVEVGCIPAPGEGGTKAGMEIFERTAQSAREIESLAEEGAS
jgi:hypothetical protein